MSTVVRLAKQAAKTYDSVLRVRAAAQSKLDALLASQVFYTLFEHENSHPYFAQLAAAQQFVIDYEKLAAMLLGCTVDSVMVVDEIRKQQAVLIHKGHQVPDATQALLELKQASARSIQARPMGLLLLDVYGAATFIWSNCDLKSTKLKLMTMHKVYQKHFEIPFIDINVQCRLAVKEIKNLAAVLLDVAVKGETVRNELEKQWAMQVLRTSAPDQMLNILLALKDK